MEVAGVSGQLWASRACSSWPVVVILSWAVVGVALVIWAIGHIIGFIGSQYERKKQFEFARRKLLPILTEFGAERKPIIMKV